MDNNINILVIGSGGREHAIALQLAKSKSANNIYLAPGNGGTGKKLTLVNLDTTSAKTVIDFCQSNKIGLVCIGPEVPLVAGLADDLRAVNIPTFGPSKAGAKLEGSKTFAKEFMLRHNIPTAAYGSFDNAAAAIKYIKEIGAPIVVKADGLAAGKGVTVALDINTAIAAVNECFAGRFGSAGASVVVEECLVGVECSLLSLVAGGVSLPLAPAKDHKRVGNGDTGPNTGGMGVYSPVPFVSQTQLAEMHQVMQQSVDGLVKDGIDFRGILYGGFMLTNDGVKVLEFNVRFGDPETQVLLPRLETDFVDIMLTIATGTAGDISSLELDFTESKAVSVVLASQGYPGDYPTGLPITGIEQAEALPGVSVFHAGTKLVADGANSTVQTAGGRVLNVTALADSFDAARDLAYKACGLIEFEGKFCRSDIAQDL